jgi:hypothetical protein
MSREEPSLETLWLKNKMMEKVQKIYRSYTAPSSKTFRDEIAGTLIAGISIKVSSWKLNIKKIFTNCNSKMSLLVILDQY